MDLSLVTSNPGKVREIRALLRPHGIEVRPVRRRLPELQAERLETVVGSKLDAVDNLDGTVLVEDSGLFITALGGFPGVYSAFVLKTLGCVRVAKLLGDQPRGAVFRTVAGLREGTRRTLFTGEANGRIAGQPRGAGGFGFDPIFVPAGSRITFAEMAPTEKNRHSHRARAMEALVRHLERRHPR